MAKRAFERNTSNGNITLEIINGKAVPQAGKQVLADRIRYYRLKRGFEQRDLASRIGITGNAISNWETGRARPDVNLLPDICRALSITLYDLFELEGPNAKLSADEIGLVDRYRGLSAGNKRAVCILADTLREVQKAERGRNIRKLINCEHALAAGVGDPSEFNEEGKPIYVYDSPLVNRADYVFRVNGDSMEPDYPDGSMVTVERIPGAADLSYGEVGAFMIGNEAYIKIYWKDGLHSLNAKYAPMRFSDDDRVYLIGRVLGVLDNSQVATTDDINNYLLLHPEADM